MKPSEILLLLAVVLISLAGQALVKLALRRVRDEVEATGASGFGSIAATTLGSPLFYLGLATIVFGACVYFTVLYTVDVSRALPVMGGFSYIVIFLIGHNLLREPVSPVQIAGLVLLIAGTLLVAR
ncbi:MAG: EamA family transporter [Thermoanaerobaculia bacterium]|nr:EamA family transporter [Thermoanaerobaculia bacterium]